MALKQNLKVLVADDDVKAKKERIGQAQSRLAPQVKAQASYVYVDGLQSSLGGIFGSLIGSGFMPKKEQSSIQGSVEQVLFAGGQILAGVQASKFLASSEAWKRETTLDQIEYDTKQAFYDCLLAHALIGVASESIKTFERHRADAAQMLEVGVVSKFELLRAETELGARQTDLESASTAAQLALANLRRILAMDQSAPLQLAGKLEWTPLTDPVDTFIVQAKDLRPELRALSDGIEAAKRNVDMKKGEFLPSAAASVSYKESSGGGSFSPNGATVSVGAQWDVFTGGKRYHEVQEAKAQVSSLEHQRADVEQLVELNVRQAYIQVQDAVAKIKREKGTNELATEGLRLAQLRFQEGVGTQVETLDADLALRQARTTMAQALRDYEVALAALDKAVGRTWVPRERPGDVKRGLVDKVIHPKTK
jgi:outer membrane protein TolC